MGSIEVDRTVSSSARHASDATATRAKVYEYYRAANESRWDDVVEFFHEDAVLLVPSQQPKVGHDAIREFYAAHGRRFVEHHDDVALLMVDGQRVMTLVEVYGLDHNDVEVRFWAAGCFTLECGRVRQYRVIFDTASLAEHLSALRESRLRTA
jgi:hypothetical protein